MAQVITTDGRMQPLTLDPNPTTRLRQMQEIIGTPEMVGEIELGARVFAGAQRVLRQPLNKIATIMLARVIVGDVVVLSAEEAHATLY